MRTLQYYIKADSESLYNCKYSREAVNMSAESFVANESVASV
jgi:hypothetical protein